MSQSRFDTLPLLPYPFCTPFGGSKTTIKTFNHNLAEHINVTALSMFPYGSALVA
jgi:hypothetical protein